MAALLAANGLAAEKLPGAAGAEQVRRYNVIWTSPSKDAAGVMPLGNGDIAAGVYAIGGGDLYLLLAKNDAFNYAGEIYKTGRVRISIRPNPFQSGKPFRQTLDLPSGAIRIEADRVSVRLWADAQRPVYHVEISAPGEIAVTAGPEFWNRPDGTKDVCLRRDGKILWYFAVGDRSVYPDDLKFYQVEPMAARFPDPYRFNTFGNLLESPALTLSGGLLTGKGKCFDIRIHACAMQTPKPDTWIDSIQRQAACPVDVKQDWQRHCAWWTGFWDRGWIIASDRTVAGRSPRTVPRRALAERHPRGGRRRRPGRAELQRVPLPHGLPKPRADPDQVQRRAVHSAIAPGEEPETQRCGRAARRDLAHARGRPALGTPLHFPEPAAALLAAAGRRRLRSDETVLRLLLQPAGDAQGHHEGLVRTRRRLLP